MKARKLAILGAGGHGSTVAEAAAQSKNYERIVFLDHQVQKKTNLDILRNFEVLPEDLAQFTGWEFIVGVGSLGDARPRIHIFNKAIKSGLLPSIVVHPNAVFASSVIIGMGSMVAPGVILDPGVEVGQNVILNVGAIVCHDSKIGDHVHLSPGSVLCGGVMVGEGAHIGAGSTVLQNLRIGPNAIIGAGAVVTSDVPEGSTVVGVPARIIKEAQPES